MWCNTKVVGMMVIVAAAASAAKAWGRGARLRWTGEDIGSREVPNLKSDSSTIGTLRKLAQLHIVHIVQ